jgi:hypothetical protein
MLSGFQDEGTSSSSGMNAINGLAYICCSIPMALVVFLQVMVLGTYIGMVCICILHGCKVEPSDFGQISYHI